MKQVILTIVGTLVIIYMVMISFSVFSTQTRKNDLENNVGRIIEEALKEQYQQGDEELIKQRVIEEITASLEKSGETQVQVRAFDLQKGIISVIVEHTYLQFNGKQRTLSCEKTVIIEQREMEEECVTVQFYLGNEVYKEYQLVRGEVCPIPKLPEEGYLGWREENSASGVLITEIGEVWEDMIYVAISE